MLLVWDYFIISLLFRKWHHISMVSVVSSIWRRNRTNEWNKYGILETFRGEPCLLGIVIHYLRPGRGIFSVNWIFSISHAYEDWQSRHCQGKSGKASGWKLIRTQIRGCFPWRKFGIRDYRTIERDYAIWKGQPRKASHCNWFWVAMGMISSHASVQKWIEKLRKTERVWAHLSKSRIWAQRFLNGVVLFTIGPGFFVSVARGYVHVQSCCDEKPAIWGKRLSMSQLCSVSSASKITM